MTAAAQDQAEHVPDVVAAWKMDTPQGLFRGVCSCGWRGSVNSYARARNAGQRHARDKMAPGRHG